MGIEKKIAWATAIGGPTWAILMWGLYGLGFVPPQIAYWLAVIVGGVGVLVAAILWLHIGWIWFRQRVKGQVKDKTNQIIQRSELIPLRQAAVWLYDHGSPQLKRSLREGIQDGDHPYGLPGISAAWIRDAASHKVCNIHAKRGPDLAFEPIEAGELTEHPLSGTLGQDPKRPHNPHVRQSELPAILAWCEFEASKLQP